MKLLKSLLSAAVVASLAAVPLSSQAGPITLSISDGATTFTVADGASGVYADQNPLANEVAWAGTVGVWTVNISTGTGVGGIPGVFGIDLTSKSTISSAPGTLTIMLSETGLNLGSSGTFAVSGGIGGTFSKTGNGNSLGYSLYADANNGLFGTPAGGLAFNGTATDGSLHFGDAGGASIALTNPSFSLTMVTKFNNKVAGQTSYDFTSAIPEPASIALVGLALLGLGAATRRKA